MAPISVPCPKVALVSSGVGSKPNAQCSFGPPPTSLSFGTSFSGFQCLKSSAKSHAKKVKAQLTEVLVEKSENSAPPLDVEPLKEEEESAGDITPDAESMTAFMSQVSNLVKLVDSRDIMELTLKQLDCELVIRKKEALQPPAGAPADAMQPYYSHAMQPYYSHAMLPPPPPPAPAAAPAASAPADAPALPPPAKVDTSSLPSLKSPMAGTFYRSAAPGAPPFVKVGDKVEIGQVLCIVEAMKLMNEIEADQSGTITEILVGDGKPVWMGMPLFAIAP